MREGVDGLLREKTRPPGIARTPDDRVAEVIRLTQAPPPHEATHWTIRAMGKAVGLAASTVRSIWKAHGLLPHRWRQFKLSNDPAFAQKLRDVVGLYVSRSSVRRPWQLAGDSPDEPGQFTSDRGCHGGGRLSGSAELSVPAAQPHLGFPGGVTDRFGQCFLPEQLFAADPRGEPVAPGRLDQDTAGFAIAGLGDAAAADAGATGMFTGHETDIGHELAGVVETGEIADLGQARRIIVTKEDTTIIEGKGSKKTIEDQIKMVRVQHSNATSDWDREKYEERLGRLAGSVAVVSSRRASSITTRCWSALPGSPSG